MSDQSPIRTARRTVLREERIGDAAFCLFCGYACLEALTLVSRKWLEANGISQSRLDRLVQEHHIIGYAHDPDLTMTLCLNCHKEITEGLAREGVSMRPEKNLRMLIALVFRASAVLFERLASSYRKWARLLENQDEL
ncbi:MAG TPA: hypothetical protein VKV95_02110 [Terriglobia bacterium]|nr:hypothetical protein [Terriglobia bacterium]